MNANSIIINISEALPGRVDEVFSVLKLLDLWQQYNGMKSEEIRVDFTRRTVSSNIIHELISVKVDHAKFCT